MIVEAVSKRSFNKGSNMDVFTKGDGRDVHGRFANGCRPGPGNPHSKRCNQFRARLFEAITPEDIRQIALQLVEKAKRGEAWAVKELFDRVFGKPTVGTLATAIDGELVQRIDLAKLSEADLRALTDLALKLSDGPARE
jgi:hypothetical protein